MRLMSFERGAVLGKLAFVVMDHGGSIGEDQTELISEEIMV